MFGCPHTERFITRPWEIAMKRTLFTTATLVILVLPILEAISCPSLRGSNKRAVLAGGYAWTVLNGNLLRKDFERNVVERVSVRSDVLINRQQRQAVPMSNTAPLPRIDGVVTPQAMYWTSQNTPIAGEYIYEIHIDNRQRFVAVTDTALSIFDGASWETISPCGHHSNHKHRILTSNADKDGLLVLTQCGLFRYDEQYRVTSLFKVANTKTYLYACTFSADGQLLVLSFSDSTRRVSAIIDLKEKTLMVHQFGTPIESRLSTSMIKQYVTSVLGLNGLDDYTHAFVRAGTNDGPLSFLFSNCRFAADSLHCSIVQHSDIPARYFEWDVEPIDQLQRLRPYDVAVDRVVADAHGTLFLLTTRGVIVVPNAGRTIALDDNGTPELIPFPNPASVDTELRLEESDIGGELTIINSMGTVVARENVTSATMRIVTSGLPAGQYGLVTTTQRSRRMGRLVVMR